jgi:hypothetical protein
MEKKFIELNLDAIFICVVTPFNKDALCNKGNLEKLIKD